MLTFVRYSTKLIVRPRATIRAVLADRRRVTFGFAGLLALRTVYLLALSVAIANQRVLPVSRPPELAVHQLSHLRSNPTLPSQNGWIATDSAPLGPSSPKRSPS